MNSATLPSRVRHLGAPLLLAVSLSISRLGFSQPNLPPGGASLLPDDALAAFSLPKGDASVRITPANHAPFSRALRCATLREPTNAWDLQIAATVTAPIRKDDVLFATFWMRSVDPKAATGRTDLILEDAKTYEKSVYYSAFAGKTWKRYQVPFRAVQEYALGDARLNFHLGFIPQTIEIGGIRLIDYGQKARMEDLPRTPLSYAGRESNAPWRAAAQARIDRYRKGPLIIVVTAHGKPVSHARVSIRQTRQAFAFGSEIDKKAFEDAPNGKRYRETAAKYFNRVVLGLALKWEAWEGQWPGYTRKETLADLDWLHSRGLSVRGHNLVWQSPSYLPKDVPALFDDPTALRKRILDHVSEEVSALKGQCVEWDVVNEPLENHRLTDLLGKHAIIDWYVAAHRADPAARLFINEAGITEDLGENRGRIDAYDDWIAYMLANKAPLGGIGLESHFGELLTPPDKVYAILSRYARHGIPIEITEYDTTAEDERLQADYLRDYLTICFSHPAVEGFLMWGFYGGDHWRPQAALHRADWSLTPSGKMWENLVLRQWRTNAEGFTDLKGIRAARGFLGDYEIKATYKNKTIVRKITLTRSGAKTQIDF